MIARTVVRVVALGGIVLVAACGPSAEQTALESRVAELELLASESRAQAESAQIELKQSRADLESRVGALLEENEGLRASNAESAARIDTLQHRKNRVGARLAAVQAQLWTLEEELALEKTLRSRVGAGFARKTIEHDRTSTDLALEKRLRSRLGAAHARTTLNTHSGDRALAQERMLRSRLGAMHANLTREHWNLHDRHQTVLVLRSKLGAGLASARQRTQALESALTEAQAKTLLLAATNQGLQSSLESATDENERRWQSFADQLKSLANSLSQSQAAE